MKSRPAKPTQPQPPTGRPMTGRISRLTSGQGQGYIRDKDGRSVFFDRRDLVDVKFNDLAVGDAVAFELIEDGTAGLAECRCGRSHRGPRSRSRRTTPSSEGT